MQAKNSNKHYSSGHTIKHETRCESMEHAKAINAQRMSTGNWERCSVGLDNTPNIIDPYIATVSRSAEFCRKLLER